MEKPGQGGVFKKSDFLNVDSAEKGQRGNTGNNPASGESVASSFEHDFFAVKDNKKDKPGGERRRNSWLFGLFV